MKTLLTLLGVVVAVLAVLLVRRDRRPAAGQSERGQGQTATDPRVAGADGFELYGLGRVRLPRDFWLDGLDVYNGDLPPAEQLAQHDDPHQLVFRFEAHARNSLGGHELEPLLMKGVRVWRWLEMNDHFGTGKTPRWAVTVYEPARALRLELFVWKKLKSLAEARALLADTLDNLDITAARAAHFQQGHARGTHGELARSEHCAGSFAPGPARRNGCNHVRHRHGRLARQRQQITAQAGAPRPNADRPPTSRATRMAVMLPRTLNASPERKPQRTRRARLLSCVRSRACPGCQSRGGSACYA